MTRDDHGTAIFLRSGDTAAWRFAVDLAGAAIACGDRVALVLFDASLASLLGPAVDPASTTVARDLALVQQLAAATNSFELIACSGAVERLGADPDALVDAGRLTDVHGLPAIWRRTRAMRLVTI